MKRLLFLIALMAGFASGFAQLPSTVYYPPNTQIVPRIGTQPYTTIAPTQYRGTAAAAVAGNKLKGADTVWSYWSFQNPYNTKFVINTAVLNDSLSGLIYLQGSENNVTWESITGITTVCTTCIGASKTLTLSTGTHRYTIDVGNTNFPYWRAIVSNTRSADTTTVTAVAIYSGTGN